MRLACPSCHATYNVPDALLGPGGRRMRCARCGTDWTGGAGDASGLRSPGPANVAAGVEGDPTVSTVSGGSITDGVGAAAAGAESVGQLRAEPRPPMAARSDQRPAVMPVRNSTRTGTVILLWLVTLLLLGGAVAACYVWRANVMAAWPPSQRLYAMLGLR